MHEPVVIRFTIHNRLSEIVEFDLGGDFKNNIRVRLSRPQGGAIALGPDGRATLAELGTVRLPADQELSHQFVLDEMVTEGRQPVSLTAMGDYTAEVSINSVFRTAKGLVVTPRSQGIVPFRIEPRNETRLRQICEDAANTILSTPPGNELSDHMKAVRVLGEIIDPVAVPCLAKVLSSTHLGNDNLFRSLTRIGGAEARALLETLATSTDEIRSRRARARVREIELGRPISN
jgi:hypothetical protein